MDNDILLKQLEKIPGLKLNDISLARVNGECVRRKHRSGRRNVISYIKRGSNSFALFKDGDWHPYERLGVQTMEEAIEWVKKDIERLSK